MGPSWALIRKKDCGLHHPNESRPAKLRLNYLIVLLKLNFLLTGCVLLAGQPDSRSQAQRFASFEAGRPVLEASTTVYWNRHSVPYIRASSDRDLFATWGYTHTHLRWAQMEILRRISQGRLAESAGPLAIDLDHTIRILSLDRGLQERWQSLPALTRVWIEAFVEGINSYIESHANSKEQPREFELLDIQPTAWTPMDVLRIGRLAAADLTLGFYFQYLKNEGRPGFEEMWREYDRGRDLGRTSAATPPRADLPRVLDQLGFRLLWDTTRSGSNSLVIGRKWTGEGALIASDPHVGIFLPNLWVLNGIESPSFHAVGLSLPGLPFIALGRAPQHAWGGTNMRTISSHLYEIEESDLKNSTSRIEKIRVRWWPDVERSVRQSSKGPILSDSPYFRRSSGRLPLALDWIGHDFDGDEISAFLGAARAKNFKQFKEAFRNYAVSGQSITYADRDGHIGLVLAARVRKFSRPELNSLVIKPAADHSVEFLRPTDLPHLENPSAGFIASANNRPLKTPFALAQSYARNDRVDRLRRLMEDRIERQPQLGFDLEFLRQVQLDVVSESSRDLAHRLAQNWPEHAITRALREWDGQYRAIDHAPVIFEVALAHFDELTSSPKDHADLKLFKDLKTRLQERLVAEPTVRLFTTIFDRTLKSLGTREVNWGDYHRQSLQTPLGALPLIGSRYRRGEFPADGSNDTLNKSGHPVSTGPAQVTYGAQSRHISRLSELDANEFVLLGGQDGWLWNPQIDDQVMMWRKGEYFRFPLSREGVESLFNAHVTRFPSVAK